MGYEWPPSRVIAVVDEALARADIANVARAPAPSCVCWSFEPSLIRYNIRYWLTNLAEDEWTDSGGPRARLRGAGARRHGDADSASRSVHESGERSAPERGNARARGAGVCSSRSLELFAPLTDEERLALASELKPSPFVVGDIAMRQGEPADSLYILARGQVGVFHDSAGRHRAGAAASRNACMARRISGKWVCLPGSRAGRPLPRNRTSSVIALASRVSRRSCARGRSSPRRCRRRSSPGTAANDATLASLSAEARSRATGTRANDLVQADPGIFRLVGPDLVAAAGCIQLDFRRPRADRRA